MKHTLNQAINHAPENSWETSHWVQSGFFQVFTTPRKTRWQSGLTLASRLLERGFQVPWLGLLEDLALWFLESGAIRPTLQTAGIPTKLLRQYRDKVVGRWIADPVAKRLRAVLTSFTQEEAVQALAWLVNIWLEEGIIPGRLMVPSQLQTILRQPAGKLESKAYNRLESHGASLESNYIEDIQKTTDIFSAHQKSFTINQVGFIESGKALLTLGQGSSLSLLIQAQNKLFQNHPVPLAISPPTSEEVETFQTTEEDYPIGGYSSITNKGRFESLLPSQLAFLDYPVGKSDLFAWKFARDELWYYSRDENALRQPKLDLRFVFRLGFEDQRTFDPFWGFQTRTLLLATLLQMVNSLEEVRSHQGLKIRWIFETAIDATDQETTNSGLVSQLGVLLALGIKQGNHSLETMSSDELNQELEKPQSQRRVRTIECNPPTGESLDNSKVPWESLRVSTMGTAIYLASNLPTTSRSFTGQSGYQELAALLLEWALGNSVTNGPGWRGPNNQFPKR